MCYMCHKFYNWLGKPPTLRMSISPQVGLRPFNTIAQSINPPNSCGWGGGSPWPQLNCLKKISLILENVNHLIHCCFIKNTHLNLY